MTKRSKINQKYGMINLFVAIKAEAVYQQAIISGYEPKAIGRFSPKQCFELTGMLASMASQMRCKAQAEVYRFRFGGRA